MYNFLPKTNVFSYSVQKIETQPVIFSILNYICHLCWTVRPVEEEEDTEDVVAAAVGTVAAEEGKGAAGEVVVDEATQAVEVAGVGPATVEAAVVAAEANGNETPLPATLTVAPGTIQVSI